MGENDLDYKWLRLTKLENVVEIRFCRLHV